MVIFLGSLLVLIFSLVVRNVDCSLCNKAGHFIFCGQTFAHKIFRLMEVWRGDMEKIRVKIVNSVAAEGLALFDEKYEYGPDVKNPHAIIVRSSQVNTGGYPKLLAVARAGAGVNNITVSEASEQGVCVLITRGQCQCGG